MTARRAIIHVDMDAFYASVEQRDDPSLQGLPLIVGGHPTRGVVLAASYAVRPFGVRSAMPMRRALRLAPTAKVVPPRFPAYVEASEHVFDIFHRYTPLVEALSLDEAFLDVSASLKLFGSAAEIARRIRDEIARELKLPASAGIAPVKFVAKLVSDLAKPNGQREVKSEDLAAFLEPLPISRLWGVGPKTEAVLLKLGLKTLADVKRADPAFLERKLGSGGAHLQALARGEDDRDVISDRVAKSVGAEETFGEDLEGEAALLPHMLAQAFRVARRLRRSGLKARGVQLKLKRADFKVLTRQAVLPAPSDDGQALYAAAKALLDPELEGLGAVRLTGISAHGFEGEAAQAELFAPAATPRDRLNQALDKIAAKFGSHAVEPADLKSFAFDEVYPEAGRLSDREVD